MASATESTGLERPVMRLYDIAAVYREIQDKIVRADGELTPELEKELDDIGGAFDGKVEACAFVIQELQRSADAAKAEQVRLAELAKVRTNAADRLKAYVMNCMEATGNTSVETGRFKLWIQRNGRPSIEWTRTVDELPMQFAKQTISLDGQAAYEAFKRDGKLPEGFAVVTGSHLRIK